ncbi:hypothetical protein LOK49_LG01G00132 [Camellia lanceoleosa]|uniref:Uncharacterized protein n=1 Tax=Camellia lanceoleosa TaxID=1840588 RepID=A0ACC0J274_9ERIC|nr:hypothetical protein LOK49_LG01G00132 [Camellia lanceoleosa]
MRSRERERERRRRSEHEEKTEGRVALRSDSHFFARAVLRSYLLRSSVRLRFSTRSMKTHERSKRSRLTSAPGRSSRTSPSHCPVSGLQTLRSSYYFCGKHSIEIQAETLASSTHSAGPN